MTFPVAAPCPPGTSLTGGSCETDTITSLQMITFENVGDRPNVTENRWDCDYDAANGGPEPVTLTGIAHAVCCACDLQVQTPVFGTGAAVLAVGLLFAIAFRALRGAKRTAARSSA